MKRRNNLDLLRLFLAGEIVVGHGGLHGPWLWLLSPVATFVCLSGFLIPRSFGDSRNWGHFAWKRFLRVGPGFILGLALVGILLGSNKIIPTLNFYATFGFHPDGRYNPVFWTLLVEEVLYAFHALSRIILKRWTLGMALFCFGASYVAYLAIALPLGHQPENDHTFDAVSLVPCFFAGNVASFLVKPGFVVPWKPILIGVLGIVSGVMFDHYRENVPLVALFPLPCMLGVLLAYSAPQFPWKMPDLSYGIYLYHFPILVAMGGLGHYIGNGRFAEFVAVVVAASLASWYLIEKPALRLKDWHPQFRPFRSQGRSPQNTNPPAHQVDQIPAPANP